MRFLNFSCFSVVVNQNCMPLIGHNIGIVGLFYSTKAVSILGNYSKKSRKKI